MRFRGLLWVLAVLPLLAVTCSGENEPHYGEESGFGNENGEIVAVISLWIDRSEYPEPGTVIELSDADAALTLEGVAVVSAGPSWTFRLPLKVLYSELTVPYCFNDDIVLNENGVRSVVAPAGTVCITDLHFADPTFRLPIEAES